MYDRVSVESDWVEYHVYLQREEGTPNVFNNLKKIKTYRKLISFGEVRVNNVLVYLNIYFILK